MVPIKNIAAALKPHREIVLAYLFGSAAKGKKNPHDVDIAVLLTKPLRPSQKLNYIINLSDDLARAAPKLNYDITILNTADPLLAFQVIKYGKLLIERKRHADTHFKVRTMTRYHDAKPLHDFFYKRAMER